jgi:hypothetical protein
MVTDVCTHVNERFAAVKLAYLPQFVGGEGDTTEVV